jgi:hypothetical protein
VSRLRGKSLDELKSNILEAVNLLLEKQDKKVTEDDLKEKALFHSD